MLTQVVSFITILSYAIVVSQSFMYILALKSTQLGLTAPGYIEIRQLIDTNMRSKFRYVIYIALAASLALVILTIKNTASLVFITAVIALVALIADILLTVKGNLPVNDVINTWTPAKYPGNWQVIRQQWFTIFRYRQVANITGFISLLAGMVFE